MKANSPPEKQNRAARYLSGSAAIHFLAICILALVCGLVFVNALSNGFVFDDYAVIVENKYIKDAGGSIAAFFNRSYYKIAGGEASYRPVATLSYYLIHAAAGLDPFYYHIVSLGLHILNAVLVYWLIYCVIKNPFCALIGGLLFACHPAQTEAVDCISYNEDLLTAFFYLGAFLLYLKLDPADIKSGFKYFVGSLFCFLLGLLSKEMAITLPAIIVLYDLSLRVKPEQSLNRALVLKTLKGRRLFYAGYLAVSLVYLSVRFVFLSNPQASSPHVDTALMERIVYLPNHIFSFIKLALFPVNLNADYVFSYPPGFWEISNLIGFFSVVFLAVVGTYTYKYSKQFFFCTWWFLLTLFPVYNIIPIFNPFADRYLYIPSVGFCLLAAFIFRRLVFKKLPAKPALIISALAAVIAIVGFYATVAVARNRDWKDSLTLWSKTVISSPNSSVAHGSLGRAYQEQGRLDEAVRQYNKALALYPGDFKAHYNLGVIYDKQDKLNEAVLNYQKAIEINPKYIDARFNLANIYQKQGLLEKAIQQYRRVIALDPDDFEARNNLGVVYAMQGNLENAVLEWEKVLAIDPANKSAQDNVRKAKEILKKSN